MDNPNNNPRVIVLPKSGPIRWLAFLLIFVCLSCSLVVFMLPLALDDSLYLNKSLHLRKVGVIVPGTVTEAEPSDTNDNDPSDVTYYRLTVEYSVDGRTYSVRNQKFIGGYGMGDSINVIYDPNDPSISQVDLFSERWFDPLIELIPF
ncbi:MAG: DUF3592 domain-containing protein [Chloroflexi bacterium]|nr:DUF3592 domain-containing protein [Chloroflexota bacterium]